MKHRISDLINNTAAELSTEDMILFVAKFLLELSKQQKRLSMSTDNGVTIIYDHNTGDRLLTIEEIHDDEAPSH